MIMEIKKRLEKATSGPWKVCRNEDGVSIGTAYTHPQLKGPSPIAGIGIQMNEPQRQIYISKENAEFISHSPEDIVFLLGEINRLEEKLNSTTIENRTVREENTILKSMIKAGIDFEDLKI